LNASAGSLRKVPGDDSVRITGGVFTHHGSHNDTINDAVYPNGCPDDPSRECRYGASVVDESDSAGEATNTYAGSHQREWELFWDAPATSRPPYGVALQATVMVPTGYGYDNCTFVECNQTKGYSNQRNWDWWSPILEDTQAPSIPRAIILCERGHFESRAACQEAILDAVVPPAPPVDTDGEDDGDGEGTNGVPVFPLEAVAALVVAGAVWTARRRR
jgi:hypothetical protein